jgi:hypothetical protein
MVSCPAVVDIEGEYNNGSERSSIAERAGLSRELEEMNK